ncbi:threonine aldolase [Streptomyces sp. PLK6-54]|uniref:Threonine aldolase n=2 Tax=Actinacidiphila acidipaludis TaxID=2873382 RepID=A0ABS7QE47_9ACTN|nr:beta-eliminating lyase-related protein [Streptomyces acidipaludis]MBY8880202.1 threonine aldolase [Streptomyces acidipaludis]
MDKGEVRARRTAAVASCRRVLSRPVRPGMRDKLRQLAAAAGDGQADHYGDGVVRELELRVAELLGMPDAAFFPTGTMAQQVALRAWAGRTGNPVVALHPLAHPEVHERGALQTVTGLRTVHPTTSPRLPSADEVRDMEEPFGTLMIELPLRDAGFVLPTWDELTATVAAAREADAVVHLDGARLWECTPHFGRTLPEIAGLADSVYVSFYKSLEGLSGAMLAASAELVAEAKAWRHRYGGMLFEQFPVVLAAHAGLDTELPRLPTYVAHAKPVARALREGLAAAGVPVPRVHPEVPHTHQFQLWLPCPADVLNEASIRQAEQTGQSLLGTGQFHEPGLPGLSTTEITVAASALEWTEDDVRAAAADFAHCVTEAAGSTQAAGA